MFNMTKAGSLTRLSSKLVGVQLFNRSIHLPNIFTKDPGAAWDGEPLTRFPLAKENEIGFISQYIAAYPKRSSPYSPVNKLPAWLVKTAPPERLKYLTNTKIVPDDIDEFGCDNFLDWPQRESRLCCQVGVAIDVQKKIGTFIAPGYASIATTMINQDGKRENTQALFLPGSNCSAFFTLPKYVAENSSYVWYEGIKGQFAAEELVPYIFQDLVEKTQDQWAIDLSTIERLVFDTVKAAIPAPAIYVENTYTPDLLTGTNGWLYRKIYKTRFPDFAIGTAVITPGVKRPSIDVHRKPTTWLDPGYGVAALHEQLLLSLRIDGAALTAKADSPLARDWLRIAQLPFSIKYMAIEKWLRPTH